MPNKKKINSGIRLPSWSALPIGRHGKRRL